MENHEIPNYYPDWTDPRASETTYWLYYGNEIVTAVRLPAGATDQEVKRHALEQHESVPLCKAFENPSTKASKIRHAEIIK